ncbi:MAG: RseC/MucC family positive regulator of sigma(E) [Marinilabiliales bacterium]|nr:MAG: RseC/MucC family positive regulator of sigma(E) [Marinilabiliales bacterium]
MEHVDHDGIVKEINGEELKVSILSKSACASCSVKGVCNPSDAQEKVFTIKSKTAADFSVGDRVNLTVSAGKGMLAVLLSYIIPVIIIIAFLAIGLSLGYSEGTSALIAFGTMALYYLILYLTRKKAENSFNFSIRKL